VAPVNYRRYDNWMVIGLDGVETEVEDLFLDGVNTPEIGTFGGKNRQPALFFNANDNVVASHADCRAFENSYETAMGSGLEL
jgi:hypothetical protein